MHDVIVIGGGPAGVTAALRARELGAKVALVERGQMGGTCTNDGCVPTRVLAKVARLLQFEVAPCNAIKLRQRPYGAGATCRLHASRDEVSGRYQPVVRSSPDPSWAIQTFWKLAEILWMEYSGNAGFHP